MDMLPEHPDLEQLRRQAKELRNAARRGDSGAGTRIGRELPGRDAQAVTLSAAQLVVARELGFASWPQLKLAVDRKQLAQHEKNSAFVAASLDGRETLAAALLREDPSIARADIFAAAVVGDADAVRDALARDPASARMPDDQRGWPPLLHACYSHWHRIDPTRAVGITEVARVLLDAGASPNTGNGAQPRNGRRAALHGAVRGNNPDLVRLLLERGANPDDRESLSNAARQRDHRCLDLLLSHNATVAGTWAVEAAVEADDAVATRMLLDAAAKQPERSSAPRLATGALAPAACVSSAPVVEALLAGGASADTVEPGGRSALREAARAGRRDVIAALLAHGATDDRTSVDRFIGACAVADRPAAEELLRLDPPLRNRLSDADRATLVRAAGDGRTEAVEVMLDLGFPVYARDELGQTALHEAAYAGHAGTVALLLERGAELDARDSRFNGTPLAFAAVGSGERPHTGGEWVATCAALLDAGASREGVWTTSKPPSEEVATLIVRYGVTPDEPQADESTNGSENGGTPADAEPLEELAEQIENAYRTIDLELMASLLAPDVSWGGGSEGCSNREQVLQWYSRLANEQIDIADVDVHVRDGAIVADLTFTRPAIDARPAPPTTVSQTFRVADGLIVEIGG